MSREQARSLRQRQIVFSRGSHSAHAAYELNAPSLTHALNLAQEDTANLPGSLHVRAATSCEIEIRNVDQAKLCFVHDRNLAQAERLSFVLTHELDGYGTILLNDLIGERFGLLDLFGLKLWRVEVNRTRFVSHVKGDRWHIEQ